jgi:hypothetical protein
MWKRLLIGGFTSKAFHIIWYQVQVNCNPPGKLFTIESGNGGHSRLGTFVGCFHVPFMKSVARTVSTLTFAKSACSKKKPR